jgi:phage shock protein A
MRVFSKLQTLLRANVRESVETVTEANAIRIYRQEIVEAEELLSRRREALAAAIASRKDLEVEIGDLQRRIGKRERQVQRLPEAECSEDLLRLAATEIAGFETELNSLKRNHSERCRQISREELALRKLLGEIRGHRREIRLLESQVRRQRSGGPGGQTISGRLAALRETRDAISGSVSEGEHLEAGMEEAIQRVDGSPMDRELSSAGQDDSALHVADVLHRLKGLASA